MNFNTESTHNKLYLECIFYPSCWRGRQMKEKCVLQYLFNSVAGGGETCGDEKWRLESDSCEMSEIEEFVSKTKAISQELL